MWAGITIARFDKPTFVGVERLATGSPFKTDRFSFKNPIGLA
jgi:hypothetical protein